MRQTHASDKKLFVDYAGDTVLVVVGRLTCETRAAQIFVAVLGASYAEATSTRCLIPVLMLTGMLSGATGGSGRPARLSPVTGFLSGQPAGCKGNGRSGGP
jgi:hypothetical protein